MTVRVDYAYVSQLVARTQRGERATTLLVDARDPEELQGGTIPTSVNIPLAALPVALRLDPAAFAQTYGRVKPGTGDRIVTFCNKGGRGLKAAEASAALGFTNVAVYSGSYSDWKAQTQTKSRL